MYLLESHDLIKIKAGEVLLFLHLETRRASYPLMVIAQETQQEPKLKAKTKL